MRAAYRDVALYVNEKPPCPVDLSDNTNLWGMPPAAAEAAARAAVASTRYPTVYAGALKRAIAEYLGVTPDMIVTGCGSDNVLDSAIRALAEPGDRFAHPDPTFPMAATFARMNALEPIGVPLTAGWDANAAAFLDTGARLTYLCSPNNPNGGAFSRDAVADVVAGAAGVVVIDEAYGEFADRYDIDLLARSDRLVIVRTLSKAFGLAGLRIGYAVGTPALVAEIEKSRGPYKVNVVAERAAVAALTEDLEWVSARIAEVRQNRRRFAAAAAAIGPYDPLPTDANFVLLRITELDLGSREVALRLRQRGIAVRPYTGLSGIGEAVRVTIGPWDLMEECLAALGSA